MANARFYSNTATQTTLSGSVSAGATSIQVAAVTGFPTSHPYTLAVDYGAAAEELVSVTAAAGTTLTVVRGYGSTSAQSHSIGAVVRHVVDAQDLTDFRTHEASTGAVHGLTGSIVGTSDTQTLSNKTLTSPTINGAALTGTVTGTSSFTGTPTFDDVTNGVLFRRVTSSFAALRTQTTGDSADRLQLRADGRIVWGSGSATPDTSLYRSAADTLATDDTLAVNGELHAGNLIRSTRAASTDSAYETRVTGDSIARWFVDSSGKQWWGTGAAAVDTNLYRSAANLLKTDDVFNAQVETTSSGMTAGTGWSAVSFTGRRTCGITSVWVVVSRTGATLTGDSQGNITDETMATIPSGWRPPADTGVVFNRGGVNIGGGTIQTDGQCVLNCSVPNGTVINGANVSFYASWVA